ncbi:MAG TPA: ABC transporter substrate binding protein, partial [Steroidobacter sp.]
MQRLRELGWIEGRTVAIEYRWAEGRAERYTEIAAEFVRLRVDVIVTVGSAVVSVKQVTSAIPIVFAVAVDPLGTGFVAVWRDRAAMSPPVDPGGRACWQAARIVTRDAARSSPV